MKNLVIVLLTAFTHGFVQAQFIKEKSISAGIGYGYTFPKESLSPFSNRGFFAQGELVLKSTNWVSFRPYLGLVLNSSDSRDIYYIPANDRTSTKALMLGGKARLRAPIPYIAPYLEIGIGTSIGKFETISSYDNINKNGITYHIPFSLGVELGKNHGVDLGLRYYFQPEIRQDVYVVAIGLVFPLNKKSK